MIRQAVLLAICVQTITFNAVDTAKQQVQLSDSYLPVAMQVIAHLTDQMAFEARDEPPKPTTSKPTKTTSRPTTRPTSRPASRPTGRPDAVYVYTYPFSRPGRAREQTTPYHRPGLYAPIAPPKPDDRTYLLPPNHHAPYTVIMPQKTNHGQPLLSIHEEEVKPLIEPSLESHLLPPHFETDVDKISRSDNLDIEDEDQLQYLSPTVREMIKLANDPDDERLIEDVRIGMMNKGGSKLSASNLRLLLLYDLLSREAKRQRLSDYYGFSADVLQTLSESASGGARAQLRLALSKMVERKDCQHEYANNRAKEMVEELGRDESKLSSEIRYLQPLVYNRI